MDTMKSFNDWDVDSYEALMLRYNAALKLITTRIEILNEELQEEHRYNPIEHIKGRIKTPESIVKKLKRHGVESTLENMIEYCNDIAGIRIICSFTSDIYKIAEMISAQNDITVLSVKDYIVNPKQSGYKSYHMIVGIPVYMSNRCELVKVEVQIRTVAMDFWASLEHKINYKFEGNAPDRISLELIECSDMVSQLDAKMLELNNEIQAISEQMNLDKK
jgi:putative GTP pyrophosphokinase